jgi:hypothetical protein
MPAYMENVLYTFIDQEKINKVIAVDQELF